ncbi:Regulator of G-protein signaling 3 [Dermatophagoides pteronyssinus]|uniref:Regulator of G-protein signaling 3 n=1 Tax=Dermatophagoides pteronyssinus TaxID=6956 RepID=A0ABQ8J9T0_DERPT|nr:Regulator of G-protein signaling 3 [Dermatophagoides pteronyssinus]
MDFICEILSLNNDSSGNSSSQFPCVILEEIISLSFIYVLKEKEKTESINSDHNNNIDHNSIENISNNNHNQQSQTNLEQKRIMSSSFTLTATPLASIPTTLTTTTIVDQIPNCQPQQPKQKSDLILEQQEQFQSNGTNYCSESISLVEQKIKANSIITDTNTTTTTDHNNKKTMTMTMAHNNNNLINNTNNNNNSNDVDPFEDDDGIIDDSKKINENNTSSARQSEDQSGGSGNTNKTKPDSCSSYSSLNNDEMNSATSLYSQESAVETRMTRANVSVRPVNMNYQRKYSLAVPGEPRYIHRRESGSRSPLNSSCGGLSPSELSTPSPSCSNSINEDQSSFSSHSIHSKHCTLSVDELFLKSSHHQQTTTATLLQAAAAAAAAGIGVGVGSPDDGDDDGIYDDLIQMDLDDNNNKHDTNSGSSNVGNTVNNKKNKHSRLVDELCRNLIHLKTATSLDNCSDSRKSNSNTTIKSIISNTKDNEQSIKAVVDSTNNDFDHNHSQNNNNKNNRHHRESIATTTITTNMKKPKQRKNSMTAIIASLLLPDSICQKLGASLNNDRYFESNNSEENNDPIENENNDNHHQQQSKTMMCSSSTKDQSNNDDNVGDKSINAANSGQNRKRKGSIAQITSASATRLVRLLRRTHSAGASKDVPSYALFLAHEPNENSVSSMMPLSSTKSGQNHLSHYSSSKDKSKSRKRRLKDKSAKNRPSSSSGNNGNDDEKDHYHHHHTRHQNHHHHDHDQHDTMSGSGSSGLEDMKQRLRFLSRRHTDSSLHASTVRPSRDEVEKWSKSFRDLMANRYGSALFRAFLCREFSDENLEFWLACEEYRKIRSSKLRHRAKKIFDNYVAVRSPREVNLDHHLRLDIQKNLATPSKFTFDEAQKKIQSLLESDSYVRFLQSDLYTDLVVPELKRSTTANNDNNDYNNHDDDVNYCDDNKFKKNPKHSKETSASNSRRHSKDSQNQQSTSSPPPFLP